MVALCQQHVANLKMWSFASKVYTVFAKVTSDWALPVNEADLGHSHRASNWPIRGATNERSLLSAAWKINASTFALHLASRSSSNSWLLQLLQLWPRLTTEFGWNPTASRTLAPDQFIANAAIPVLHFLAGHAEPWWKTHKIWLWPMFYAKQPFCTKYLQNPTNTGLKCITWHLMTKHLNLVMSRVNQGKLKMWPRAFAKDWINVDLVDPLQLIRPHLHHSTGGQTRLCQLRWQLKARAHQNTSVVCSTYNLPRG